MQAVNSSWVSDMFVDGLDVGGGEKKVDPGEDEVRMK
jgi:hypothetical protein